MINWKYSAGGLGATTMVVQAVSIDIYCNYDARFVGQRVKRSNGQMVHVALRCRRPLAEAFCRRAKGQRGSEAQVLSTRSLCPFVFSVVN